jgi:hypothetical protein
MPSVQRIQGNQSDDVIQRLGLSAPNNAVIPVTFHLKMPAYVRSSSIQKTGIIQRNVIQIKLNTMTLFDHVAGFAMTLNVIRPRKST